MTNTVISKIRLGLSCVNRKNQMYLTGNGRKPTATFPNIGLIAALMDESAIGLKNSFDGDKIEIQE